MAKTERIIVRMDEAEAAELDALALAWNVSRSEAIRCAVSDCLQRQRELLAAAEAE